jgi:hypothetical protein
VPFKSTALPNFPATQAGLLTSVPFRPLPVESDAVAPLLSSNLSQAHRPATLASALLELSAPPATALTT